MEDLGLTTGWRLAITPADACAAPRDAASLVDWIEATAPGAVAQALRRAGRGFDRESLLAQDAWYRRTLSGHGVHVLSFEGLAGPAEVWLDEAPILSSDGMFQPAAVEVGLSGEHTLWIAFRALGPRLDAKLPRARWRPKLFAHQGLRGVRTSLLGHTSGWRPALPPVGPWRPVRLQASRAQDVRLQADWLADAGRLTVSLTGASGGDVECAGVRTALTPGSDGRFHAALDLPDVQPWWPHSHGAQPLHPVVLHLHGRAHALGRVGFRSITVDHGADGRGFGLIVNGVPVFARGAVWVNPGVDAPLTSRADYAPSLGLAREAGMNMLRVSGVGVFETRAFFDLCDELGILVWQDFMFANFDYPQTDDFLATARREAEGFLAGVQGAASLAVLCGGSEVFQQAAMLGLDPALAPSHPLFAQVLPQAAREGRPDVAYVANSPCAPAGSSALPFLPGEGVAHYYGVGAYERGLEDARLTPVRFAAECLAFANVGQAAPADPAARAGAPRDPGAAWDFADIRDHYLARLYGVEPAILRRDDPALYLDLSRAATGEAMEAVFAAWRRADHACAGGLVWMLQDAAPGSGWGVIDSAGEPKPAFYALKRAFRPVQITLHDEGGDGLSLQLHNDTDQPVEAVVELACLAQGRTPVVSARHALTLAPRRAQALNAFTLLGRFFDITGAYRFGPPAHDVTLARLTQAGTGVRLADAFHHPQGRGLPRETPAITARVEGEGEAWALHLATDVFAPWLHIEDAHFRPEDDGFALAPGFERRISLIRRPGAPAAARPAGEVLTPGERSRTGYAG